MFGPEAARNRYFVWGTAIIFALSVAGGLRLRHKVLGQPLRLFPRGRGDRKIPSRAPYFRLDLA